MRRDFTLLFLIISFVGFAQENNLKKRVQLIEGLIPLTYNSNVSFEITKMLQAREGTEQLLSRAITVKPTIDSILSVYRVPQEFLMFGASLSNASCLYENKRGRSGFFALKKGVGVKHGLKINRYIDERKDLTKAVAAFAIEIAGLKREFGSWDLAAQAYLTESKTEYNDLDSAAKSIIQKEQIKRWREHFSAISYLMYFHKSHDLKVVDRGFKNWVPVSIQKLSTVYQVATGLDVDYQRLKEHNAKFVHEIIPGNNTSFLLVPGDKAQLFTELGDKIYTYQSEDVITQTEIKWVGHLNKEKEIIEKEPEVELLDSGLVEVVYHVRNGDILLRIADYYDCEVVQIKRWNRLRNDDLDIDQPLLIKVPGLQKPYYLKIDDMTNLQRRRIAGKD